MTTSDLSFIAPVRDVSDWRMVLLVAAATDAGLLDALPGGVADLANRLNLDAHAVMVVLEALAQFGVVQADDEGIFGPGPQAPDDDAVATLHHHARAMGQWARSLDDRLRGAPVVPTGPHAQPARWLASLAVGARRAAPASVDACLARLPGTRTVLDLGGGHGEYAVEFARRGCSVTMQDRPGMIDVARERGVEAAGVTLFPGDFFETLAEGPFDLVFCSGVTNTFSGERNVALYERVRSCLAPGGCLVIQTAMRDRQPASAVFGVQMLVVGNGGDAHPERLYRQWLGATGYSDIEVLAVGDNPRPLLFAF